MNTLLGNIGVNDVADCGELTLKALSTFGDVIDPARVGVYGGSHGGFLSGWLIGHQKYKDLFKVACLWNPVLNMNYMAASTDIPDWITACTEDKMHDWNSELPVNLLHSRSPISQVSNVTVPCLLIVGDSDLRVPPH
jgi:acylaminoacyl-peptidase